ncbi:MAG: hypothetical protein J07HX5_00562 [halophilic archaeon J07HX5]|jgi:hypothetical protein|nr:MAG: hypothetical protein J07HX5_00562 [halophilic archaeon J07HX5]
MALRDAVESDADRLAGLADTPTDVMRNLVHDRTVRVLERDGETAGFVSYDAQDQTIHITQIEGQPEDIETLLAEPVRFAREEEMTVELLIPEPDSATEEAASAAGFEIVGRGPTFDGEPTRRFRTEPS